jgi:hypothetical protein
MPLSPQLYRPGQGAEMVFGFGFLVLGFRF